MNEFKIESGIPLPDPEPEEAETELDFTPEDTSPEPEEDTRWQPYRVRGKKPCRNSDHNHVFNNRGVGICTKCGDIFPCPSGNCGHHDCADPSIVGLDGIPGNGTKLPDWAGDLLNVIDEKGGLATVGKISITLQEDGSGEAESLPASVVDEGPEEGATSGLVCDPQSADARLLDPGEHS